MLFWPPLLMVDEPNLRIHRGWYKLVFIYINLMNQTKSSVGSLGQHMRKAAHRSDGVDS
jgi:hypothetical protein